MSDPCKSLICNGNPKDQQSFGNGLPQDTQGRIMVGSHLPGEGGGLPQRAGHRNVYTGLPLGVGQKFLPSAFGKNREFVMSLQLR